MVVLLSTGTRMPGAILFDPFYHVPYGWLLREPGRFLMLAGFAYSILVATVADDARRWPLVIARAGGFVRWRRPVVRATYGIVLAAVLAPAFPLVTGALVSGPHKTFPSSHVQMPMYWTQMASYLNRSAPSGNLLVLPPNDFYQMPYTWYYGNDGFITDLVKRHVLDPVPNGYIPASEQLAQAVNLLARSLLARDWQQASRLAAALGTPLVLVRGDVRTDFPGRTILSPEQLMGALSTDPLATFVQRIGSLVLYRLNLPPTGASIPFATVAAPVPNLRDLAALPTGTGLITHTPIPGHPMIIQLPPLGQWTRQGSRLSTTVAAPRGWRYAAAPVTDTGTGQLTPVRRGITDVAPGSRVIATTAGGAPSLLIEQSLGRSLIVNGEFQQGPWAPLGNCNATGGPAARSLLGMSVLRKAGPGGRVAALRLSAGTDSACEATNLQWHGGSLLLQLFVRHIAGAPPRMCLWETPIDRCVTAPALPSAPGWTRYRTVVSPDPGAKRLGLFLYADSSVPGQQTTNEYADVLVNQFHSPARSVVIIGSPATRRGNVTLTTNGQSFSTVWTAAGQHVIVNGLTNGWLAPSLVTPMYRRATWVIWADRTSIVGAMLALVIAGSTLVSWWEAMRRRQNARK
ncbi:MAG: hypothetical protein ACYCYA_05190, partial [Actinomycetes bacterium]